MSKLDCLPERVGNYAGVCILDDGEIFYCGGCSNGWRSWCFKINLTANTCERLADFPSNVGAIVPLQVNEEVYTFGNNLSPGNKAFKYSLKKDNWYPLPKLPINTYNVSSISFKGKII